MTVDQITAHFQEYAAYYGIGALVLLPIIFFTRRFSVPAILWSVEIAIYFIIFHVFLHGLVLTVRWFNKESQMKFLVEEKTDPGWTTPLLEFWDRSQYNPEWIIYLEGAFLLGIILLVIRMRPMKVQKVKPKPPPRKPGQSGYRPGQYGAGRGGRGKARR